MKEEESDTSDQSESEIKHKNCDRSMETFQDSEESEPEQEDNKVKEIENSEESDNKSEGNKENENTDESDADKGSSDEKKKESDDSDEKKKESDDSDQSDIEQKGRDKKKYMIFSEDEEDLDDYECGQSSGATDKDRLVLISFYSTIIILWHKMSILYPS